MGLIIMSQCRSPRGTPSTRPVSRALSVQPYSRVKAEKLMLTDKIPVSHYQTLYVETQTSSLD